MGADAEPLSSFDRDATGKSGGGHAVASKHLYPALQRASRAWGGLFGDRDLVEGGQGYY